MLNQGFYEIRWIPPSWFVVTDIDSRVSEFLSFSEFRAHILNVIPKDVSEKLEELLYAHYDYVVLDARNNKVYVPKKEQKVPPHIEDLLKKIAEGRLK